MAQAVTPKNNRVNPTNVRSYIAGFLVWDSPAGRMKNAMAGPSEFFCTDQGVTQVGEQSDSAHAAGAVDEFQC